MPPPTDRPPSEPGGPATSGAAEAAGEADLGRRRFFRQFAGEIVQTAATVMGAANAIQRTSAEAAASILDPDSGAARIGVAMGTPSGAVPALGAGAAPSGFRTPYRWEPDRLVMIDQRRLPGELVEYEARSASDVAYAIRDMIIRGAPAIGQVAAIGLALSANRLRATKPYARRASLRGAGSGLKHTRPTAVNLAWAVDRMLARLDAVGALNEDGDAVADALWAEAEAIVYEATDDHGRLGALGAAELPDVGERPLQLLTHCNTGPLACGQFGTALGVVQVAHHSGRSIHVWVDETRPYLQGARLTAWELAQAGVPHTLIADVAAASVLAAGDVDAVLVGADRVAANGDTANKVGTYPLAVLAARHGVPFYVCVPLSSVDPATPDGAAIPIERRPAREVTHLAGAAVAPEGTAVFNPAFDVTPAELVTAIVTEEGVLRPPFGPAIEAAFERSALRRARPAAPAPSPAPPSTDAPATAPAAGPAPAAEPAPVLEPAGALEPAGRVAHEGP